MKKWYLLCGIFAMPLCNAEIFFNEKFNIPLRLSGYVKYESFWDSRQVVGIDSDQVLLYPKSKKFDDQCNDINNTGQYNASVIQTRLRLHADGPPIRHASSFAVVEGDFFGRADIAEIFDLRHAYFNLSWKNTTFLAGQTWHLMYAPNCDARTISFNSGLPIDVYARDPQIRLEFNNENYNFAVSACTELNFVSDGPIGYSSTYMRNSVVPNFDIRLEGNISEHALLGAILDYKRIRPRIETNLGYKTDEKLNSVSCAAYNTLNYDSVSIYCKAAFAQNGTNLSLIGGYGVHTINPETDVRSYANINTFSIWTDWQFRPHKPVRLGFFLGYIKNLGSRHTIQPDIVDAEGIITERRVYGFGTDIDHIVRFSPRATWKVEDFEFAGEIEYTRAVYGTLDNKARVKNHSPVNNVRLLLALFYFI